MATHAYSTNAPEDGAHHRTRRAIEAYIEKLIALLDQIDDDPDLEPDADGEPWLAQVSQRWMGGDDDRELDLDSTESDTRYGLTVDDEREERDSDGEFSGGCLIEADRPGINVIDISLWRRA